MKWQYEQFVTIIDRINFLYIDGKIDFGQKSLAVKAILDVAGWTWDEMMDECESRLPKEK